MNLKVLKWSNIKVRFYCLFGVFMFWFSLGAESQNVNDLYNLDFQYKSGGDICWMGGGFVLGKGGSRIGIDSTDRIGAKYPLCLQSIKMLPKAKIYLGFYGCSVQKLFIPGDYQNIQFALNAKSVNLSKSWLKVTCLDEHEKYLVSDSVFLKRNGKWDWCQINVSGKNARFFRVEIGGEGKKDLKECAKLVVDHLSILGDGKEIGQIDLSECIPQKEDFCLDSFDTKKIIPRLEGKKVVVLAETVSQDSTTLSLEKELVTELVEQGICKLIFVDMPFDRVLLFNLYIQGSQRVVKDRLMESMQAMKSPVLEMNLLEDLRNYNRTHEDKVNLLGLGLLQGAPYFDLSYFLKCISSGFSSDAILKVMHWVYQEDFQHAIAEWDSVQKKGRWEELPIDWVKITLQLLNEQREMRRGLFTVRNGEEFVASQMIKMCIDSLLPEGKQVLVAGSWDKLNKKDVLSLSEISRIGHLKACYGDSCLVIGVLRGEGNIVGMDLSTEKEKVWAMEVPQEPWSLEHFCAQQKRDVLFGSCLAKDKVSWIRYYVGLADCEWMLPVNLSERMDAFLWIK